MRAHLAIAATTALLLAIAPCAQAQKPALTKNVDEPGRSPYFDQALGACASLCSITFKAVPDGYRLVLTYASVQFRSYAGSEKFVLLQQQPLTYQAFMPAPGAVGVIDSLTNSYVASGPVTFYVEAGAMPQIVVNRAALSSNAYGSVSGYLVALP